jgi:hypothetical protein
VWSVRNGLDNDPTLVHMERNTEFDTQGRLGRPRRLVTQVINDVTCEVVRYATIEFHNEGRDCESRARSVRNVAHGPDLGEITFDFQHAVVSGVDNVPEAWPQTLKTLFWSSRVTAAQSPQQSCNYLSIPQSSQTPSPSSLEA